MSPDISTLGEFVTEDLIGPWSPLEIGIGIALAAATFAVGKRIFKTLAGDR